MTVEQMVGEYSNLLFKICVVMLADEQDTQDVIQDTFCAYLEKQPQFADREHEKAWLIRVAVNRCKDILRFRKRHPSISEEELRGRGMDLPADGESRQVLEALWELPARQRAVIYLYYVEGYRVREIAEMLRISNIHQHQEKHLTNMSRCYILNSVVGGITAMSAFSSAG